MPSNRSRRSAMISRRALIKLLSCAEASLSKVELINDIHIYCRFSFEDRLIYSSISKALARLYTASSSALSAISHRASTPYTSTAIRLKRPRMFPMIALLSVLTYSKNTVKHLNAALLSLLGASLSVLQKKSVKTVSSKFGSKTYGLRVLWLCFLYSHLKKSC